ncbi:glycosyltransferase [Agromyces cerinus]|uniref:Poly(Glycerol-phosphate) alpha-glucosyltransferase n=1 Tax=Agromyces cerinus subsp. cerinus TaxID=232089 RepID=A0A1N6GQ19_9MICO|nr:glycosyltransferase [Agromyces cerinus]SIO09575.1 poly(glycerol-phosphate) alpha-glucosyltransferase [Agromyces cerinus subsp. cerinus]
MTRIALPDGRHFAVTWSIPDAFGGMTDAMLRRSAAFHRVAGVEVDVLTFDARPDTPDVERMLRERGVLAPGVRIVNLYDWLRSHPLPGGSLRHDPETFTPLAAEDATETRLRGDRVMSRSRLDAEGNTLQTDHYRDDGTLLLSDRHDTRERGVLGGRSVVLCDRDGRPVRSWRRLWTLYRAWLDALTAGESSYLIVDSKTMAPFMRTYRRAHAITAHVVHASHRSGPTEDHPIRRSRREVLEHLDDFDLVAVLSLRQRHDLEQIVGRNDRLVVIPNPRPLAPEGAGPRPSPPRDPARGIVLAALTRRKRVSHAIAAAQAANARAGIDVHLDVYGDGESRPALERRITDPAAVELHGFDPDARQHLPDASFLLLTSHSEGFPLVLVEAMAAGCLPIAYDIPYGPADLIRDGRNGFLVPPGDVDGLTDAIVRLQRMSPRRVARMRAAAVRTASRFDEDRVTRIWARELHHAEVRREVRRTGRFGRTRAAASRLPLPRAVRSAGASVVSTIDHVARRFSRVG